MNKEKYIAATPIDVLPSPYGCSLFFETSEKIFAVNMDASKYDNLKSAIDGMSGERPTTFEFFREVLASMSCKVVRVDLYNEECGIYFARVNLAVKRGESTVISEIDARPSDAVALALRCCAPVYVDAEVLGRIEDTSRAYHKLKGDF